MALLRRLIAEPLLLHSGLSSAERRAAVDHVAARVQLPHARIGLIWQFRQDFLSLGLLLVAHQHAHLKQRRQSRLKRGKGLVVGISFIAPAASDEAKAILAANTTATNASNAPTVAFTLEAASRDGNYTLQATAWTRLFNTTK